MALVWGLGLFAVAIVIHLAAWRLFKPVRQYLTLLGLYAGILVAASVAMRMVPVASKESLIPANTVEYLTFAMLYTGLAFAYVSTFSAVQADSPSLLLLLIINEAGDRGVSRQELDEQLGDNVMIIPRVQDLITGGLAVRQGPRYVIEPRGALLAAVHTRYRAFLKMGKGG